MSPTKPGLLLMLATPAGVIGFCTVELLMAIFGIAIPVPWTAAATLLILAVAIFIWALLIRPRLMRKKGTRPISPFIAARTAALAMAASRTGAIVGGFYLGVALELAVRFENGFVRQRLWLALAAVVGSILMVLAALWLEYICRLPDGGEGSAGTGQGAVDDGDWVLPLASGVHQHPPRRDRRDW